MRVSHPSVDRRLMPRPLPVHLASAILLWLSSRAALTSWPDELPRWSGPAKAAVRRLEALVGEIDRRGRDHVVDALDQELRRRAAAFIAGIESYRGHKFCRVEQPLPVRWQQGAARLLDYGREHGAPAVLLVPSLINRYYILDLLPERSFARYLAAQGLRPLVLDWGEPGGAELGYDLSRYIAGPLEDALTAAVALGGRPVGLIGYCMGGLLALALALRRPAETACLALLATPWDFHAERPEQAALLAAVVDWALDFGGGGTLPVWLIQSLFLALDPFLGERKFIRFAELDPDGEAAQGFVGLEDWINDGVPLARRVALDCARSWYRDNAPSRGEWRVAGTAVQPAELAAPTLVVLPRRDKIVPPRSAAPLAQLIPGAKALRPPFGHIGMMASEAAPEAVWQPIAEWLRRHLLIRT